MRRGAGIKGRPMPLTDPEGILAAVLPIFSFAQIAAKMDCSFPMAAWGIVPQSESGLLGGRARFHAAAHFLIA
jgi:hypothetical protein